MKRVRFPFVRCIKGKYWYFRTKETGDIRLPGSPFDPCFQRAYAQLLTERQRRKAERRSANSSLPRIAHQAGADDEAIRENIEAEFFIARAKRAAQRARTLGPEMRRPKKT